ncbi:hypothetical protein B1R94_21595 [Mycolicibacterium litorale]|nr:hypothetical protein B1R94_21595 [Mycolicibacterium litorale]
MPEINRRRFLLASAGVGAAGLLSGTLAMTLPELLATGRDRPLAPGTGILVIVTLYGGNDGINTVIPYADGAYHDARPELAYSPEEVLRLDDRLGLNPGLKGLSQVWKDNHLAIVRGVSYPKPDHSHFRSMDIWQTASPDEPVSTGWIGRWLDDDGTDPVHAVNVGAVLPPLAVGENTAAATLLPDAHPLSASTATTIAALGKPDIRDTPAMAAVTSAYRASGTADATFAPLMTAGDGHSSTGLAAQLRVVADCVKAAVPTRVYMVDLDGFDTHANERSTQQDLLTSLDTALTPFLTEMAADQHGKGVVVLVYSEFGRRVHANASQGTDHGTAGPVFVAGAPVRGGFYGDEPSLTDLDNGDLKTTTDFRDVYHELLAGTLGADPGPCVGPGRKNIGFL